MIALSHLTKRIHTVYLSTPDEATKLFELAKTGDTLHIVDSAGSADEVMNQIGSQLVNGKYKTL